MTSSGLEPDRKIMSYPPMGYLDIIIFAAIAGFLLFKLRNTFGQRSDDEPRRPNPFVTPAPRPEEKRVEAREPTRESARDQNFADTDETDAVIRPDPAREGTPRSLPVFKAAPDSLIGGIEALRAVDASFDEKTFLQGARAAFTMIVGAFAAGDLKTLKPLLSARVFGQFEQAVKQRIAQQQQQETKITALKDVDLVRAKLEGGRAMLTVQFVSEQINVLRDAAGAVIEGNPNKPEAIEDIWTFSRDPKSSDLNWVLVETRS
jgi:predicted lipid-binding transport protein (Tim44 family)